MRLAPKATSVRSAPVRSPTVKRDHGMLRQRIVEQLLADVIHGGLTAGRHLVTQDLADRFRVSHTPIREALIALAGIGIIDLVPNRGAIVRKVTSREFREVLQVRRALECEAVRLACGRIDPAELQSLAAEMRRLAQPGGMPPARFIEQCRRVDSRLHDLISDSCGNRFLAIELDRLKMLFRAFRDVSYTQQQDRRDFRRLADEASEHLAIVEGLLSEDRKAAARAMAAHLQAGMKYWTREFPEAVKPAPPQRNGRQHRQNGKVSNGATR